jgi:hypothetical protein
MVIGASEVRRARESEKVMSWPEVTVKAVCNSDEVAFCSSANARREMVAAARSRPRPPEHPPASDYVDPLDLSISMST